MSRLEELYCYIILWYALSRRIWLPQSSNIFCYSRVELKKKIDCASSSIHSLNWDEELESIATFVALNNKNRSKRTRAWVREINKKREITLGEFHSFVQELNKDPKRFYMCYRMTMKEFDTVLIRRDRSKQNTSLRKAISTGERIYVNMMLRESKMC